MKSVVSTQFSRYVAWILANKFWKIGWNPWYICWITEFFS